MYVVDITINLDSSDMLCGKDSMDAKRKTLNYIKNYVFAYYHLEIDQEILDYNLTMDHFSLKRFLKENYSMNVDRDLLIQSFFIDKGHCLFVKYQDDNLEFPVIYPFEQGQLKTAQAFLQFLVNDTLIEKYQDNLLQYEKMKMREDQLVNSVFYFDLGISCKVMSLYKNGMFLEELLNKDYALSQIPIHDYKEYGI